MFSLLSFILPIAQFCGALEVKADDIALVPPKFFVRQFVGFEVLTAVVMKSSVFWDIMP
jgi:hypothetical protein